MRPRKRDIGLPQRMYFRRGRYYYVLPASGAAKPRWIPLERDLDTSLLQYQALISVKDGEPPESVLERVCPKLVTGNRATLIRRIAQKLLCNARDGAKARDISFSMTAEDIIALGRRQDWRCAITGLRFELADERKATSGPYGPSLDRINRLRGYEQGNVRLVCVAVNFAMNQWGEQVFSRI